MTIRVAVVDLSLQLFGDHDRVAQEIELASICMAAKLTHAGCEIATKKPEVLSSSVSVRAKVQMRSAPLGAGNGGRTEPWNRLCVRKASVHSGANPPSLLSPTHPRFLSLPSPPHDTARPVVFYRILTDLLSAAKPHSQLAFHRAPWMQPCHIRQPPQPH